MNLSVEWPESAGCPHREFMAFLQFMANRYVQGHLRYGLPNRRKKYMTRARMELDAYARTGNIEHLANIANYCALEVQAPENRRQHFDAFADSVTRGQMAGL